METKLSFKFWDTEKEAMDFAKKVYAGYSRYKKNRYKLPQPHECYFKDGSGGWIVWFQN